MGFVGILSFISGVFVLVSINEIAGWSILTNRTSRAMMVVFSAKSKRRYALEYSSYPIKMYGFA